ncbi:hypothetical protein HPB51_005783 [Rhipicephalus microplus]|uniref:Uncharacterized protein n=1 Tax=Rhipicephalus microplus TaxID=6941 RepID=A0A9J6EN33_RHIMP|nr:hypothetical protein HPB51_005783 [Rhipicephalus microplus]
MLSPWLYEPSEEYPQPSDLLPMPELVRKALSGPGACRYLREVVSACRETTGFMDTLVQLVVQGSFCNEPFSSLVIRLIMRVLAKSFKVRTQLAFAKAESKKHATFPTSSDAGANNFSGVGPVHRRGGPDSRGE